MNCMKACVLLYNYYTSKWYIVKAFNLWSDAEVYVQKYFPKSAIIQLLNID